MDENLKAALRQIALATGLDPDHYLTVMEIAQFLLNSPEYVVVALQPIEGTDQSTVEVRAKGSAKLEDMHALIDYALEHRDIQNDIVDQANDLIA